MSMISPTTTPTPISADREQEMIKMIKEQLAKLSPKYIYDNLLDVPQDLDCKRLISVLKPSWHEYRDLIRIETIICDDTDLFGGSFSHHHRAGHSSLFRRMLNYCLLDYSHLDKKDFEQKKQRRKAEVVEEEVGESAEPCEVLIKSGKKKGGKCGKMNCYVHKRRK